MIDNERELRDAVNQYGVIHGRFSARDLERDVTPQMTARFLDIFNHTGRIDHYRLMLKRPKMHGINTFMSLGEDFYAHQDVLLADEWEQLVVKKIQEGGRAVRKARHMAEVCERKTGHHIDVDKLIRQMVV